MNPFRFLSSNLSGKGRLFRLSQAVKSSNRIGCRRIQISHGSVLIEQRGYFHPFGQVCRDIHLECLADPSIHLKLHSTVAVPGVVQDGIVDDVRHLQMRKLARG